MVYGMIWYMYVCQLYNIGHILYRVYGIWYMYEGHLYDIGHMYIVFGICMYVNYIVSGI